MVGWGCADRRWFVSIALSNLIGLGLAGCGPSLQPIASSALNSRQNDEQPALSGDGRFLAYMSNRGGQRSILLYDLQRQQLVEAPRLNRQGALAESPSLSYTGRYIVYMVSSQGRPELAIYDRATQRSEILLIGYRGWICHPNVSPDGRYITFESGGRGQWDIEVIDRGPMIELDLPDGQQLSNP